jgi:glycerol-3-phosphate O-acyltransferase
MLTPRLGMLSAIVNAYLSDARRDLYLAPVSIHYGRIVEEAVYGRELRGASKETESIRGLLKARHFLKQKFGTVYLSFGEPISLGEALGENRKRFSENAGDPEVEEEKRKFVQKFGFRILRAVNDASPAGATSISATVLLGATHAGSPYPDYASQANALAELALSEGVKPTASLERNLGNFRESLSFLSSSGLIEVVKRSGEEVLVVPESKRLALDFYKNNLIHTFLVPSLVTTALLGGVPETALAVDVAWGLNLLRYEFPLPERDLLEDLITRLLCHYRERCALRDGRVDVSHPLMRATAGVLDNFYESYFVVLRSIEGELPAEGMSEKQFLETTTKHFETSLLLGEVSKQEASTTETFKNAISRFAELRYITVEGRGRGGREKWLQRGPEHAVVGELAARLSGRVSAALIRGRQ